MDPINSNSYLNSARLFQNQQAQQKPTPPVENASAPLQINRVDTNSNASNDYSNLFDDDALLKLQGNLEAIAQMAEQSLKQIDS